MPMMKSRFRGADSSATVGLLTALGVYLIYNDALPSVIDVRSAPPHDNDAEMARKHAAWKSALLLGVVYFVARDINSYIISGAALVGIDAMHKHANAVNPMTGKVDQDTSTSIANVYPMPDYEETNESA